MSAMLILVVVKEITTST